VGKRRPFSKASGRAPGKSRCPPRLLARFINVAWDGIERGDDDRFYALIDFQRGVEGFNYLSVWSNAVRFLTPQTGTDPIVGQGNNLPQGQEWLNRWDDSGAGSTRISLIV
jgi:hypothetical protein